MTTQNSPASAESQKRPTRPENAGGELKSGFNIGSETFLDKIRQTQIIEYSPDTYKGKTQFEAYVIANPYLNGAKPPKGDFGVRVRCRIDEIYKHLPPPKDGKGLTCAETTLYPEFTAESLESIGLPEQPPIGTGLIVEFIDRTQTTLQYGNGRIIGASGKLGNFVTQLKKSPIEEFVENNCREIQRKYNRIQNLNTAKFCTPTQVYDWRIQACLPSGSVSTPVPKPPPETDPIWNEIAGVDEKLPCDVTTVLSRVRKRFNRIAENQTDTQVLAAIKQKIWWHDSTAEAIAKLHPDLRDKTVNMLYLLSTSAKSIIASAPSNVILTQIPSRDGVRSLERQMQVYAKGRLPAGTKLPGGLVVEEAGCVVGTPKCKFSNATEGQSYHNFGLAFDVYPLNQAQNLKPGQTGNQPIQSGYQFANEIQVPKSHPVWDLIVTAGKQQGLVDGRSFNDTPHFQLGRKSTESLRLKVINGQVDSNGYVIL